MALAAGRYDNDGYLDLFVTALPTRCITTTATGTFTDVTKQAGVSDAFWTRRAAFIDYDRDGKLDLFVANYVDFTTAPISCAATRWAHATTAGLAPTIRFAIVCTATRQRPVLST